MRLLITSGQFEAEIQGDPLARIKKQLASISQQSELDISKVRAYIDKISELKDRRIDDLISEFQTRSRLEDMEIEELKALVASVTKDDENNQGKLETDAIRSELQANASKTKDIINRINDKIDRILKDNTERSKRLQEEIGRISSEGKKKVSTLKEELGRISSAREKERKQVAITKAREYLPEHKAMKEAGVLDGRKFMGKLNFKPKLPI